MATMVVGFILRALWLPENSIPAAAESNFIKPQVATEAPLASSPSSGLTANPPSFSDQAFSLAGLQPNKVKSLTWDSELERADAGGQNFAQPRFLLASAEEQPVEIAELPKLPQSATTSPPAGKSTIATPTVKRNIETVPPSQDLAKSIPRSDSRAPAAPRTHWRCVGTS